MPGCRGWRFCRYAPFPPESQTEKSLAQVCGQPRSSSDPWGRQGSPSASPSMRQQRGQDAGKRSLLPRKAGQGSQHMRKRGQPRSAAATQAPRAGSAQRSLCAPRPPGSRSGFPPGRGSAERGQRDALTSARPGPAPLPAPGWRDPQEHRDPCPHPAMEPGPQLKGYAGFGRGGRDAASVLPLLLGGAADVPVSCEGWGLRGRTLAPPQPKFRNKEIYELWRYYCKLSS